MASARRHILVERENVQCGFLRAPSLRNYADVTLRPVARFLCQMTVVTRVRAADDEVEGDAAIVQQVRDGDIEAFGAIVTRHHGRCLLYALRVLRDRTDAEDAVQQTFVRAYRALGRYQEQARFLPWLLAILANECRALTSQRTRRLRHLVFDDGVVEQAVAPDVGEVVDDGERLERALGRIEPRLREAFLLHHVEGLTYEEMSASTGAGRSALKMRVKRACEALRAHLEER